MPTRPTLTAPERRARAAVVRSTLQEVSDEVGRLPLAVLHEIAPVLAEAEREVARGLRDALGGHGGDEKFTTQAYRNTLIQLRAGIAKVKAIEPKLFAGLAHSISGSGNMATRHLTHEVATFSAAFEGSVRSIDLKAAALIATGQRSLIPRFRTSAKRYAGQTALDIKRQLAVGVVKGETFGQMGKRLVRLGGPKGNVALAGVVGEPGAHVENIAEGLFTRYRHVADRLVRTEVIEGYNVLADEGIRHVAQIDPEICRRWDASNDWRACIICRDLDDVVVGVDQLFPGGLDHPTAHPRCRCVVCAWRKNWDEANGAKYVDGKAPERARRRPSNISTVPPVVPPVVAPEPPKPPPVVLQPLPPAPSGYSSRDVVTSEQIAAVKFRPAVVDEVQATREPFNARRFAEALRVDGDLTTAKDERGVERHYPSSDKQFATREEIRNLLAEYGIKSGDLAPASVIDWVPPQYNAQGTKIVVPPYEAVSIDKAKANGARANSYAIDPGARDGGYAAIHTWQSEVRASWDTHRNAYEFSRRIALMDEATAAGDLATAESIHKSILATRWPNNLVEGFEVFVHEELHGASRATAMSYVAHGQVIEEVTTEVAARKIVRDKWPEYATQSRGMTLDLVQGRAGGTYGSFIGSVISIVSDGAAVTIEEAAIMVEDASIAVKRWDIANETRHNTPEELSKFFVSKLERKGKPLSDQDRTYINDVIKNRHTRGTKP